MQVDMIRVLSLVVLIQMEFQMRRDLEVNLFMNDENFVSGGQTDLRPVLLAKIFDENGINTVGNGIGHDITAYS